jgi:hypothetical protein
MAEADLGRVADLSRTVSCGCCELVRPGLISPTDTRRSRPVIGGFSSGVMTRIMTAFAHELSIRGAIDVREAFIDASFAPAKKVGKTKRGKSTKIMAVADRNRLPVSVCVESATP